jgi:hypothetical protein
MARTASAILDELRAFGRVEGPRRYSAGGVYFDVWDSHEIGSRDDIDSMVNWATANDCELGVRAISSFPTLRFTFDEQAVEMDVDEAERTISTGYN